MTPKSPRESEPVWQVWPVGTIPVPAYDKPISLLVGPCTKYECYETQAWLGTNKRP